MIIMTHNEQAGIFWYKANNYKHEEVHVVCYGLQVKQFPNYRLAKAEYKSCVSHWEVCEGL